MSVEFLRHKGANGKPVNELVGSALVNVPSNPEAQMLSVKAAAFNAAVQDVLAGKSVSDASAAMVQAIHDAAGHLGAVCIVVPVVDDMDPTGAEDGANADKAAALQLRLKALSR